MHQYVFKFALQLCCGFALSCILAAKHIVYTVLPWLGASSSSLLVGSREIFAVGRMDWACTDREASDTKEHNRAGQPVSQSVSQACMNESSRQ